MQRLIPSTVIFLGLQLYCSAQDIEAPRITWSAGPAPHYEYRYHAAVAHGNMIYVAGGMQANAFEFYDPKRRAWSFLPQIPTPRAFASAAVIDTMLYLCGGLDSSDISTAHVEVFNLRTRKWRTAPSMQERRSRFATVAYGGKLYAIGGIEVDPEGLYANLSSIECFDPALQTWSTITGMKVPRHGHGAVAAGDKIFITGGFTANGQTGFSEMYDLASGKWEEPAPMPTPRGFFGLVNVGTDIYAIGGRVYGSEDGPVERFSLVDQSWTALAPLPDKLNRFACVSIDGVIYIIGGEETPDRMLVGKILRP